MEPEEGDVILCTVDRIVGTTVFVTIEGNGEGSIVVSEISPGRIRNLRDFVVPKKKIVCKVLRTSKGNIELSLRRVTIKEKNEVMNAFKQEKRYKSILNTILGKETDSFIKKIENKGLVEFMNDVKKDPEILNSYLEKKFVDKIIEILSKDKKKKSIVKKEIVLRSYNSNGLLDIKDLFKDISKNVEVLYLSAGKYSLKLESTDLKKADNELNEIIREIEKKSKKLGIEFKEK
ncbi:hypothetical protein COU57_03625 [Candidatus Pacearchaeota archaeon CG10_big_fil_rev_8_21_14_0_10_32_14]|nr:MAG: hypothetical protein COU57_03625 [Candidatus Pacearchaeota archaeon CG10_big_fil_rev_8_21_14_0_10_32_14]